MDLSKVEPLLAQLSAAFDARDFSKCVRLTRELFLHDACVAWNCGSLLHIRWSEWMAGENGSFRAFDTYSITYTTSSKPGPAYRIGNHWSGGASSGLSIPGSERSGKFNKMEFERAKRALRKVATG